MVNIKQIIFFFYIFACFIVFCPASSLSTSQSNDNQLPIENTATINQLRFWSNIRYTRIVIDLDNEVSFNYNLTKFQSTTKASARFSIDIQNSMLSEKVKRIVEINDESIMEASRENAISSKNTNDLHDILSDLLQNAKGYYPKSIRMICAKA